MNTQVTDHVDKFFSKFGKILYKEEHYYGIGFAVFKYFGDNNLIVEAYYLDKTEEPKYLMRAVGGSQLLFFPSGVQRFKELAFHPDREKYHTRVVSHNDTLKEFLAALDQKYKS